MLCDQVSQASFIKSSNASLWFVLNLGGWGGSRILVCTAGEILGLSYLQRAGGREIEKVRKRGRHRKKERVRGEEGKKEGNGGL